MGPAYARSPQRAEGMCPLPHPNSVRLRAGVHVHSSRSTHSFHVSSRLVAENAPVVWYSHHECPRPYFRGRIVWSRPGRNAQILQAFFDELGERKDSIKAISIDMSGGYEKAIRAALPDAQIASDPFHVVALAGRAVDDVRHEEWNAKGKSRTPEGKWIKKVRWALRKAPESLTDRQRVALAQVQQTNARLYRAYLLKEQLRALYHLDDPAQAPEHLKAWLAWASRSKLKPFIRLAHTLRRYRDGILAAVTLGLANARLEGLHSKVRPPLTPQLRLPLRCAPHRPHLPLLHRDHHQPAPPMNPLKREKRRFPRLGVLRSLRHTPAATADGAPALNPKVRRAPPGCFPRSPSTGRQGRRPAIPRCIAARQPQHAARPRPPDLSACERDGPDQLTGPSATTSHSRQFPDW
jgi:hypothetical protein